jgi:hypothetical protein
VLLGLVALCSQLATATKPLIMGFDDMRMESGMQASAQTNRLVNDIFNNLAGDFTNARAKTLKATKAPAETANRKIEQTKIFDILSSF